MDQTEAELLLQLKARKASAIEAFVNTQTDHLYNTCVGMGLQAHDAEEVTQAVWLTFFDVIEKFEGRSSVRTFLFGILYNKIRELRRQDFRVEAVEDIEAVMNTHFDQTGHWIPSHAPMDPHRFLESTLVGAVIEKCMEALSSAQRMAFLLKEAHDETTEAICEALNVSTSNLGVLLFRARNHLRECIERKSR